MIKLLTHADFLVVYLCLSIYHGFQRRRKGNFFQIVYNVKLPHSHDHTAYACHAQQYRSGFPQQLLYLLRAFLILPSEPSGIVNGVGRVEQNHTVEADIIVTAAGDKTHGEDGRNPHNHHQAVAYQGKHQRAPEGKLRILQLPQHHQEQSENHQHNHHIGGLVKHIVQRLGIGLVNSLHRGTGLEIGLAAIVARSQYIQEKGRKVYDKQGTQLNPKLLRIPLFFHDRVQEQQEHQYRCQQRVGIHAAAQQDQDQNHSHHTFCGNLLFMHTVGNQPHQNQQHGEKSCISHASNPPVKGFQSHRDILDAERQYHHRHADSHSSRHT